ncbi:MAG: hypothetical protein A2504_12255 [Bdellovibrionales bacterium RIFOXYD12_FULL_39_22]|nr:MAG: hypothetical protein A2385_14105 [Bdellovibrionales bacterium RIFOXYB1_FULL_39_21]OFZ42534.1 MAG: hypothetical protein A2485_03615 [Bdellovibrionales bacterium RIFOXYC12_FULL_39_17]OFZ45813.1 MAG: hypothetical protein A2404_02330 [Bdellovibrionales bacterium RIFOXYC1_FULL_39_130]OFZ74746.1 MAG: hypothetical protein A2560_05260 [Bdellovibrionales bacterium RIFOXYD1_FULL_39_84]OFZ93125.1 MAG: hypothetical protein A2504_12255 [Bdellovibrionales bacterium RIFOXYD12_FULL_39_22]HLE12127.1 St
MALISSGLTDIGMKRTTNQDSIYLNPAKNIYIVADGMGGHSGGDIASSVAVTKIPEFLLANLQADPVNALGEAIRYANSIIHQRGAVEPQLKGMGTTVTSLYFKGDTVYVGNVGDSRTYLINQHKLFQLSKDHSLVQEKLNLGIYSRQNAADDPMKNVLIRTVGYEENVDVDVFTYKVLRNDIFLLCSDGLHGKVSDSDITFIINKHLSDPKAVTKNELNSAAAELIKQANANGGQDNISVVLVLAQ